MTKDKNILLVLALVLACFAAWRIFSYRASHGQKNPAIVDSIQQTVSSKSAELFKETPTYSAGTSGESYTADQNGSSAALSAANGQPNYTAATATASSTGASAPAATRSRWFSGSNAGTSSSYSASTGTNTPQNTSRTSYRTSYTPAASEQMARERANNLSPYLLPNKEVQKKLDTDFQSLEASITRAVQAALMPKSKKDANIEKYLNKGNTAAASANANPMQDVVTQIANQKKDIVQSVSDAFGNAAGQRAGQLMDNFQKDLTDEISKTGQDPQVTAQNVQKIAKKYQQQFDQMNRQNQYDQFVKELTAQYRNQAESLKKLYPGQDQLNAEFSRISNEALQKELALPSKNMTPEEYAKARYDIQYQMRQEMEEAIKNAGSSLSGLHKYDNEQEENILNDLRKKEQEGTIVSVPFRESDANIHALSETLLKESNDMLAQVEQAYGVQAISDFKPILDDYYQKMMKTMQDKMTMTQRRDEQKKLRMESNRRILEMQRDAIIRMENIPAEQKEEALQAIEKEINALPKM